MFSYYPRYARYPSERKPASSHAFHAFAPRHDERPSSDRCEERRTRESYTCTSKAPRNPTVFGTYNPETLAEFVSKEVTTTLGPSPEYIDGYAIYTLEDPMAPRVRVLQGREVCVSFASEAVLKFYLPRGTSAMDIEANLCGNKLMIRVPHCLSSAQECHVVDVHDGPLGDEYDEYGYYESLCENIYAKEQERKRREEERRMRERLEKIQQKQKEVLARKQDRYVYNDLFEPSSYFPRSMYRPNLSMFLM